jgi:hypothetical protein
MKIGIAGVDLRVLTWVRNFTLGHKQLEEQGNYQGKLEYRMVYRKGEYWVLFCL